MTWLTLLSPQISNGDGGVSVSVGSAGQVIRYERVIKRKEKQREKLNALLILLLESE